MPKDIPEWQAILCQTLDYSEFYADLRINNNLSLIAKFKRDDESTSKIESVFGLGYENCCFVFE